MIEPLALATATLALVAGLVTVGAAAGDRHRWRAVAPTLAVLQLAALVQAVAVVVRWVGGHRPGEPATHLAYLAVSVLVVPVVAVQVARDDGRWAGILTGVGLLVLAVVTVRLQVTYRPAGG